MIYYKYVLYMIMFLEFLFNTNSKRNQYLTLQIPQQENNNTKSSSSQTLCHSINRRWPLSHRSKAL